ncbi:MAG: hypothetical protein LQ338_008097, partial [Usnochroma carphineum]
FGRHQSPFNSSGPYSPFSVPFSLNTTINRLLKRLQSLVNTNIHLLKPGESLAISPVDTPPRSTRPPSVCRS